MEMLDKCVVCNSSMNPHPNKKYCSASCKQKAYEDRANQRQYASLSDVTNDVTNDVQKPYGNRRFDRPSLRPHVNTLDLLLSEKDQMTIMAVQNEKLNMMLEFAYREIDSLDARVNDLTNKIGALEISNDEIKKSIEEDPKSLDTMSRILDIVEGCAPAVVSGLMSNQQIKTD